MNDCVEGVTLTDVFIQSNGIIRNSKGYLIGRLSGSNLFETEHVKDLDVAQKRISPNDSYFDVSSFVEGTEVEDDFDDLMTHISRLEGEVDTLRKEQEEYTITINTLARLVQEEPTG